jgi:Zn-dependent peptidase ImmA (M78 family)/transcriptional regulator with XRE-family HTH domain
MARGTPGFTGGRLKEAREARGYTAISLADYLEVTRAAVSQYENGIQSPGPAVMQKICTHLKLPERFFLRPMTAIPTGIIFYRSMSALTKAARIKAERRYMGVRTMAAYLARFVELPSVNLPCYDIPQELRQLSMDKIESLALETRAFWKLSEAPIANLTRLLENNGVIVSCDYFDTPLLDAFSEWSPLENRPYIIFNLDKPSAVRIRTDLAHELGSLLLHREVNRKQLSKITDLKLLEEQAFAFARAFLLPSRSFAEDIYSLSLDAFVVLKRRWNVAIALMIRRAEDLKLVNEDQSRQLWINRTRRGWRTQEPLDDELEIEKPWLLAKSMKLLITESEHDREEILWQLPYSIYDFERLLGVERHLLTDSELPATFRDHNQTNTVEQSILSSSSGRIIPFQQTRREDQ